MKKIQRLVRIGTIACAAGLWGSQSATAQDMCAWTYEPVCGLDGERYSNACFAGNAGTEARAGGALIELFIVDDTLWVWSSDDAFIDEAIQIASGELEARVPSFALRRGQDCTAPHSFHVDSADMHWADLTIEVCDGRIVDIESDIDYWVDTVQRYCPWHAEVISVHDYR